MCGGIWQSTPDLMLPIKWVVPITLAHFVFTRDMQSWNITRHFRLPPTNFHTHDLFLKLLPNTCSQKKSHCIKTNYRSGSSAGAPAPDTPHQLKKNDLRARDWWIGTKSWGRGRIAADETTLFSIVGGGGNTWYERQTYMYLFETAWYIPNK